ncbi:monofunctional biosynthetic peptidoglycan transglycosylase [Sagittula salina]|uniref:Biosynthetic peptidoglycan transglycosylase n=1 Tax=Sagittula salina TaxID=2820268 RepID=A0A940MNY3_9RHOB|nr:monofunctional biosynthetic peptidoglycan transglycosylase [Sagittula salina]MBP0482242.1 monofunctional biosynthetic peptidoglycan transglycosylase [Sagittula salina]
MAGSRAKPARKTARKAGKGNAGPSPRKRLRRLALKGVLGVAGFVVLAVALFSVVNPPSTHTIWSEKQRLGHLARTWVDIEAVAPAMARSVVAAEDANFCEHWGFDMDAIRAAIADGSERGGSTISQQVVKNVYLWQDRSWVRKALEAGLTPLVEAMWSKRRILEVYLNVAEFDEGVFGIDAASWHYFGVAPGDLSARQAALLAAVLPSPKTRDAAHPDKALNRRARAIQDGAATIAADGRAACFETGKAG